MTLFRKVNEAFSVAPQLTPADLKDVKAAGFKTVLCNRPDTEGGPDQPTIREMQTVSEDLGLTFLALPFAAGIPAPEIIAQQGTLIATAEPPVLAYCRSGTRSITAWALSQAGQGKTSEILKSAEAAGYDLSGLRQHL